MSLSASVFSAAGAIKQGWELAEERVITSASTTEDFTVDGEADGGYMIEGVLVNDQGTGGAVNLRVNGANAVMNNQYISASGTSISTSRNSGVSWICSTTANKSTGFQVAIPVSRKDDARMVFTDSAQNESTMSKEMISASLTTPAASTAITSIGIGATAADNIGVGSVIRVWKRRTE